MQKLLTPNFTVAFPQIDEPKQIMGQGKLKYSMTMLFDLAEINKDPEQKALWDNMVASVDQAIADKGLKGKIKKPFIEGETCISTKTGEVYDGFEGKVVIRTTTQTKPGLVDQDRNPIIGKEDFYSGCVARATVNAYAWSFSAGQGVSFGLQNIQKVAEGERFAGGASKAEDDFSPIETPSQNVAGATDLFN